MAEWSPFPQEGEEFKVLMGAWLLLLGELVVCRAATGEWSLYLRGTEVCRVLTEEWWASPPASVASPMREAVCVINKE